MSALEIISFLVISGAGFAIIALFRPIRLHVVLKLVLYLLIAWCITFVFGSIGKAVLVPDDGSVASRAIELAVSFQWTVFAIFSFVIGSAVSLFWHRLVARK